MCREKKKVWHLIVFLHAINSELSITIRREVIDLWYAMLYKITNQIVIALLSQLGH